MVRGVDYSKLVLVTILILLLSTIMQVQSSSIESADIDDDFPEIEVKKKPHRRKSARLAFIEETDDPMFKFLVKILNTAQLKHKNALARAKNGIQKTEQLKTEVTNTLKKNHISVEYFE